MLSRRPWLKRTLLAAAVLAALAALWLYRLPLGLTGAPIKVGILHSLTGTMAISEQSVVDATQMAIDEVNAGGGVLGRRLVAVVADGKSDWPTFAAEAERLIVKEHVSVIFGCWTSASRKEVKPVVERLDHLLFYPVQYEGLEESPNIVYTGAAPNQQILPAVRWSVSHLGKRAFLVGSDYVFPRTANALIREQLAVLRGEVAGEAYVPLGSQNLGPVVQQLLRARPVVVFNTINGDSNVAFFRELRAAGATPERLPVMSFSISEDELRNMDVTDVAGHYAAWNYFQSVRGRANQEFVAHFKGRYGARRVIGDPMEAAYLAVHLWARAADEAGSAEPKAVRGTIGGQSMDGPGGLAYVDPQNHHTWKTVRVGRVRPDGQFEVVWESAGPVRPVPFPMFSSRAGWERFLDGMYRGWGGRWARPAAS